MKINPNNIYISQKSTTCMSIYGKPLSVYDTYSQARQSADFSGNNFTAYKCEKCGKYHIKPQNSWNERHNNSCSCRDHKGNPKNSYKTCQEADKISDLKAQSGVYLSVYKCPEGNGWHLTSRI